MEYVTLGSTGIKVSRICLGTVFRSEGDEPSCLRVIDKAIDLGCNFIDCANAYRDGFSEQVIGKAIHGRRDRLIITTKVGAPTGPEIQSGGLSRTTIRRAVEASLIRLKTDYIDLYLCHFPDPDTPLEETLGTLDELVRQGKIRYPGCSNFPAWQVCESLWISDRLNLAKLACNQVAYSLLDRRIEEELIPFCAHTKVGITAYAATVIGLLSGRYRYGQAPPPGSPWALGPYNYRAIMTRETERVIRAVAATAKQREKSPVQVALAWCLARPQIASVIVGADTTEHVEEDFGAVGWMLSAGEVTYLDSVSRGMRIAVCKDALNGYDPEEPWPEIERIDDH
jgi:aryl-alcohol dehydrogenase-like predicted oxidoreductase